MNKQDIKDLIEESSIIIGPERRNNYRKGLLLRAIIWGSITIEETKELIQEHNIKID